MHLPAKLVSQLARQPIPRIFGFGRTQHRQPRYQHTQRTHDQRQRPRIAVRPRNCSARPWSVATVDSPLFSCCYCPAIAVAAAAAPTQPSQAPSHNVNCSFQRCAALLPCSIARPTPSLQRACPHGSLTADAGPAPVAHLSFQQYGQRVSVAVCYQT